LRCRRAGTGDAFNIEATPGHELPKPECRSISQVPLRGASRSVGFGRVETDKSKGLSGNSNCVAIQHLNLTWIKRRSIRDRGDKGESDSETADHWRQLCTQAPLKPFFDPKKQTQFLRPHLFHH
jgi:hypothetical protein